MRSFGRSAGLQPELFVFWVAWKRGLGPEKLLANGVKCSVPSQFCLSLGFISNQLCPDLEEGQGEGRIRDGSCWRRWCLCAGNGDWS